MKGRYEVHLSFLLYGMSKSCSKPVEVAPHLGDRPAVIQVPITHGARPWAGFKMDKHFSIDSNSIQIMYLIV